VNATAAQQNKDLVLGALAAAKAGDIESFFKAIHPRVQIHEPAHLPYGGLHEGPDGFVKLLAQALDVLDLGKLELISATADDERTILLMTVPLLATGEVMHITEHWRVEHGMVTDVRVFWFDCPDFGPAHQRQATQG
jgi:hypothetical protein